MATLRLRADRWRRVYETFSTQIAKFLLGIQRLVEAASPSPSPTPYIPDGARREPAALQQSLAACSARLPGGKLCSKEQFGVSGCYSSPGPATLILTCAGRITILTGGELAPTRHLFMPTGLLQGFAGKCEMQREGVFLHTRQVMCKICSPPAKICCLKYGLSMLLHMNSECENPACPSVP